MAARSGRQFLDRLSAARVHVEVQGETLTGHVNDHPAVRAFLNRRADTR
jgi:4-hydroxyphenylacetate 3-monooxygenase